MDYDYTPIRPAMSTEPKKGHDGFIEGPNGKVEFVGVTPVVGLVHQRRTVSPSNLGGMRRPPALDCD